MSLNALSITTVDSGDDVAVREKRADYRYETCQQYVILESYRSYTGTAFSYMKGKNNG